MRRMLAVIGGAIVVAALACSLVDRTSDFFTGDGKLVTLAVASSAPMDLALTQDYVYFRTVDGIYRVRKTGGALEQVLNGEAPTHLASDGANVIAWSDAQGVHARMDDAGAELFMTDAAAQAVAAATLDAHTRIAYALAPAEDDASSADASNGLIEVEADGSVGRGALRQSGSSRITIASSGGVFFFSFANTLAQEKSGTTTGRFLIGNSGYFECPIAGFQQGFPPDQLLVDTTDAGAVALMIDNAENVVHAYAGTAACCQSSDCFDSKAFAVDEHTLALHGGTIYRLTAGTVVTYPIANVAVAGNFVGGTTIDDSGASGTYPAVDGKWLFFVTGNNRIQRLTLSQ